MYSSTKNQYSYQFTRSTNHRFMITPSRSDKHVLRPSATLLHRSGEVNWNYDIMIDNQNTVWEPTTIIYIQMVHNRWVDKTWSVSAVGRCIIPRPRWMMDGRNESWTYTHPRFENFSPSLPLIFINRIEGCKHWGRIRFFSHVQISFSLSSRKFKINLPMPPVSSNNNKDSEPLIVKRRPSEKCHPGRGRRMGEQRSSRASGED